MAWIKTDTGYTDGRFVIKRGGSGRRGWAIYDAEKFLGTRIRLRNAKGVCENISAIPPCAASMGCLCAGHARGIPASARCDTDECPDAKGRECGNVECPLCRGGGVA